MPEHAPPPGRSAAAAGAREHTHGGALVARLHGVLRGLRLYDASNRALLAHQQELIEAVRALECEEVSLLGLGTYIYLNGIRLRPEPSQLPVFRGVLGELHLRRLGGLRFSADLDAGELETFLRTFHDEAHDMAASALDEMFSRTGMRTIGILRARDVETSAAPEDDAGAQAVDRHRTQLVFQSAIGGTRDAMQRTARMGRPALHHARRVVQPIVDRLLRREPSMVGLAALKRRDDATHAHCVNVSVLAIHMGQLLGYSRAELASLGVAALLHDAGKLAVPDEVLHAAGPLDETGRALMERHCLDGLRVFSRLPGLSQPMLDAMRVAFEHHMNVDHSGYPVVRPPRELGAFSRIVAVADCFDAVTSPQPGIERPLPGHEALRRMLGPGSERFDPAALWALVRTVGLYPAGTLLRTRSGRLWLSVTPHPTDPRRPVCRELLGSDPVTPADPAADAPLAEDDPVAEVVAADAVALDVEAALAA